MPSALRGVFLSNKGKYVTLWLFPLLSLSSFQSQVLTSPQQHFPRDRERVDHRLAFRAVSGGQGSFRKEETSFLTAFSGDFTSNPELDEITEEVLAHDHETGSGYKRNSGDSR